MLKMYTKLSKKRSFLSTFYIKIDGFDMFFVAIIH